MFRPGTIPHWDYISDVLLFLVKLQSHGHLVAGFFCIPKLFIYAKSFTVAEIALSGPKNAQGCRVCKTCLKLFSPSLFGYIKKDEDGQMEAVCRGLECEVSGYVRFAVLKGVFQHPL